MLNWFQKLGFQTTNFQQLLDAQLALASQALHQLEAWCRNPSQELLEDIFRLETEGDGARQAVAKALAGAFETPLDREDLSDLSRKIDDLLDESRSMVRLGTALKVQPQTNVCEMVANLHQGIQHLRSAMLCLPDQPAEAEQLARQARRPMRLNERLYSTGVSQLYEEEDIKFILRQMELYHAVIRLSQMQKTVADRLDHAIHKLT